MFHSKFSIIAMVLSMNYLRLVLMSFLISLFVTSSNAQTSSIIARKWRLDENSIVPFMKAKINLLKKVDPVKAKTIEERSDAMQELLRNTTYEFVNDGTFETKVLFKTVKGTWRINQNVNMLYVTTQDEKESPRRIVSITGEKMVLIPDYDKSVEITYNAVP